MKWCTDLRLTGVLVCGAAAVGLAAAAIAAPSAPPDLTHDPDEVRLEVGDIARFDRAIAARPLS